MNKNHQSHSEGLDWCCGGLPNSLRPSWPAPAQIQSMLRVSGTF